MRDGGAAARRAVLPLALLAALLHAPAAAHAHARSVSWSSWELDGREASVVLRIAPVELTRLPAARGMKVPASPGPLPPTFAGYLTRSLRLVAGEQACPVAEAPRARRAASGRAHVAWRVRCPAQGPLRLESGLFREVAPGHLHFVRVRARDGTAPREGVLRADAPALRLEAVGAEDGDGSAAPGSALGFLRLGVEHIATGADHLVFLLALLLLARRVGEVVTIVTGFTLAHSLTLALAVLGRLRPEAAAVEALIGLSIALVAAENAWLLSGRARRLPGALAALLLAMAAGAAAGVGAVPALALLGLALFVPAYFGLLERSARPMRLRIAIAFAFGLVHGFGFAGILAELALPPARLVASLAAFNVGVELGQLAAVAAAWPLLRLADRWRSGGPARLGREAASGAVAGLGVFWLVTRAYLGG